MAGKVVISCCVLTVLFVVLQCGNGLPLTKDAKEVKPAPKEVKPAPKVVKPAPKVVKPAPKEVKPAPKLPAAQAPTPAVNDAAATPTSAVHAAPAAPVLTKSDNKAKLVPQSPKSGSTSKKETIDIATDLKDMDKELPTQGEGEKLKFEESIKADKGDEMPTTPSDEEKLEVADIKPGSNRQEEQANDNDDNNLDDDAGIVDTERGDVDEGDPEVGTIDTEQGEDSYGVDTEEHVAPDVDNVDDADVEEPIDDTDDIANDDDDNEGENMEKSGDLDDAENMEKEAKPEKESSEEAAHTKTTIAKTENKKVEKKLEKKVEKEVEKKVEKKVEGKVEEKVEKKTVKQEKKKEENRTKSSGDNVRRCKPNPCHKKKCASHPHAHCRVGHACKPYFIFSNHTRVEKCENAKVKSYDDEYDDEDYDDEEDDEYYDDDDDEYYDDEDYDDEDYDDEDYDKRHTQHKHKKHRKHRHRRHRKKFPHPQPEYPGILNTGSYRQSEPAMTPIQRPQYNNQQYVIAAQQSQLNTAQNAYKNQG